MRKMKKILAIVLAAFTVLSLAGCGSKKSDKKTLTFGFDVEFPPYGFVAEDGS